LRLIERLGHGILRGHGDDRYGSRDHHGDVDDHRHLDDDDRRRRSPAPAAGPGAGQAGAALADHSRAFLREVFADTEALWLAGVRRRRPDVPPGSVDGLLPAGPDRLRDARVRRRPVLLPGVVRVYLDPTFFAALSRHAGVDLRGFAQAYVIAHEVAHHVQTLLGLAH
jgi:uncharacterized protein